MPSPNVSFSFSIRSFGRPVGRSVGRFLRWSFGRISRSRNENLFSLWRLELLINAVCCVYVAYIFAFGDDAERANERNKHHLVVIDYKICIKEL